MRSILVLAGILVAGLYVDASAFAQDDSPEAVMHPLVGSWNVTLSPGMHGEGQAIFSFFADGNVLATDTVGRTWQGQWVSTGARGGKYSLVVLTESEGIQGATFMGTAEVNASGDEFDRFPSPQNSGGMTIHGTRITVDG